MSNKTLRETVENIESIVRDIAFELKGESKKEFDFANSLIRQHPVDMQPPKSAQAIPFLSDEDLKKILVILNNCIHPTTEYVDSEKRSLLYEINDEMSWKIADILDMDMNGCYYDIETLEMKKY